MTDWLSRAAGLPIWLRDTSFPFVGPRSYRETHRPCEHRQSRPDTAAGCQALPAPMLEPPDVLSPDGRVDRACDGRAGSPCLMLLVRCCRRRCRDSVGDQLGHPLGLLVDEHVP